MLEITMLHTKARADRWFQYLVNALLLFVLLAVLLPLWRVVMTSLTPISVYTKEGVPFFLWPWEWSVAAYEQLLGQPSILRATLNSVVITVSGTALSLALTIPLAYALSTRTLPGRNLITTLILFTFLFHPGLIPNYLLVTKLGLRDNILAVILPPAVSVYNTLVMKSFFEGIPEEVKEAARMDGANDLQVLLRIILPLSVPILLTIGLFYAVSFWNEFFTPILYLNDAKLQPLPVLLRNILSSASVAEYVEYDAYSASSVDSIKSASVLLTMIPMLVVYPWIQRHFTKGTLVGAVKE
jgi:putative aldouronate transport system permease protein